VLTAFRSGRPFSRIRPEILKNYCNSVAFWLPILAAAASTHGWFSRMVVPDLPTMICSKRTSVVFSLVVYVLATSGIHAMHDHSALEHCCVQCKACAGPHAGMAHQRLPSRSTDRKHSCLACEYLAAKAIAAAAVTVVEQNEALYQVEPRQHILAPVIRPALPLSRGPPCA
jgi:hypothetical protein